MVGVPSLTLAYDYDANGNRTDETRTEIALPGQPARTVHTHYGFDSDDRLTSAEVTYTPANPQTPNTRTVWTLDPVGNRLTEVVTNTQTNQALNSKTYTYSARDQLETVTDSVTQLRVVYGYDLNGNRTQRTVTRGPGNTLVSRTFYRFDARDRLVKAEPEAPNPTNIPTVEFVYDAEDRKIARIETPWLNGSPNPAAAQASVQLYDGQTLLHEAKPGSGSTSNSQGLVITDTYRNSAKLDRHVSYGPNGNDPPTIRFYQLDALGTPLILTDSNGQAIVSNTVDAWGNTVQQTADGNSTAPVNSGDQSQDPNQTGQAALLTNDDQTIGFTGYQKDEDLGLYYAGARFYDPLIGGFGAMDPWTGDTGRPITLNKYLYANGNPVFFVDPDGRTSIPNMMDMLFRMSHESTVEGDLAVAHQTLHNVAQVNPALGRTYGATSELAAPLIAAYKANGTIKAALNGDENAQALVAEVYSGMVERGSKEALTGALSPAYYGAGKVYDFGRGIGEHAGALHVSVVEDDYIGQGRSSVNLVTDAATLAGTSGLARQAIKGIGVTAEVEASASNAMSRRLDNDDRAVAQSNAQRANASERSADDAVESPTSAGTALKRQVAWAENQNGPRTLDEAIQLAEESGVDIGEDYRLHVIDDEVYDRRIGESEANFGNISTNDPYRHVTWRSSVADKDGLVHIRIRRSVLNSDERIVWVLAHESFEIEKLREAFQKRASMSFKDYKNAVRDNNPNNLHCQANSCADAVIRERRKRNESGN